MYELSGGAVVPKGFEVVDGKLRYHEEKLCPFCNTMRPAAGFNNHSKHCRKVHANVKAIAVPQNDKPPIGIIEVTSTRADRVRVIGDKSAEILRSH
jgi:hypothetical protein